MPNNQFDVTKARIIPERTGPNQLTREYPKLSGFLQGLMGTAPDEVGGGSVLDEDATQSKQLQQLGAKYGFPIGTLAQMLPFGGGIAKAPSVAAGSRAAQRGVVKLPGGNWRAGVLTDAVKPLKHQVPDHVLDGDLTSEALGRLGSMDTWIDSKLASYIKNDMATERDPIRALAEQGPIHFQPVRAAQPKKLRAAQGFSQDDYGTSDLARQWERTADFSIRASKAGDILKGPTRLSPAKAQPYIDAALKADPWLAKVPPETSLYQPVSTEMHRSLGFDHLIDELRNAINPASGLPQDLLLKYEALKNVSVSQAVERVAKINAWREAQAANTSMANANNAAVRTFKEYKENNPKGLRWAELGIPKDLPEGFVVKPSKQTWQASAKAPAIEKDVFQVFRPDGSRVAAAYGSTEADAINAFNATAFGTEADARIKAFQDAIRFEGDAMGHSAAGYADVGDYGLGGLDAIREGRAKIFTLRDGKHQPHVTIEVGTTQDNLPEIYTNRARTQLIDEVDPEAADIDIDTFEEMIYERARQLAADAEELPPDSLQIFQIKGKGNNAPSAEYLPYVQDFVKSGKWSAIDDLQNAGLYEHPYTPGKYLTKDEFNIWKTGGKDEDGYASGGLVHDVTKARIIPERQGPSRLTREYPELSGFLQGLMGTAPDEVGGGSVLDEDAQSSRKLQALGAKYGFPIGTIAGMLPFGGGIAKAPSVAAGSRTAQKGIVKLPGGNWLSGSAEDAVRGLKRGKYGFSEPYTNEGLAELEALIKADPGREGSKMASLGASELQDMREKMAVNNWIDSQLVKKYIKNDMATERDPLRLMADAWPEKKAAKLAEVQARIDALAERTRQLAIERGQPEHTLVEMRQQMIPLEKEKALIEGTEGLHYTPAQQLYGPGHQTEIRRLRQGFPEKGVAKAGLGTDWEDLSDRATQIYDAGDLLNSVAAPQRLRADPWLAKVPPKTPVAGLHADLDVTRDLGFDHLIDELRNSLNPESGLPKELLMRYQDLPKVTVPQVAERVAQINAWRAAKKQEADLLTANNAATVLHKDYPENGLKWVEMKVPPKTGKTAEVEWGTPDELWDVPEAHTVDESEKLLADALKYEGDQMAHCVGGYCPDVLEGRSRIFSLRDAKGKPHTTIEVLPADKNPEELLEGAAADIRRMRPQLDDESDEFADLVRDHAARLSASWKSLHPDALPLIKQIKGYKNQAPDPEYLPYVQDFVKSGKWSDVGDLHNTGLRKAALPEFGIAESYYTPDELSKLMKEAGVPESNLSGHLRGLGFAQGGLVSTGYNPSLVNARAAQLEAELFN